MISTISILGSTGSIGTQTLEVAKNLGLKVCSMSAGSNIDLFEQQIKEFQPKIVSISSEKLALELKRRLGSLKCEVLYGIDGLKAVAIADGAEMVVTSLVGVMGLIPTIEAIRAGKHIALANKETLVAAGKLVMDLAKKHKVSIIPVDSEHSAVFQSLQGNHPNEVEKIILTASGGPFRGFNKEQLENVTLKQALKHPNWSMGSKITIDSATMMNKGLEVIEAKWLFDIEPSQIEVVVHPQSIIHSMVQYIDGSVIAQLGCPDMRLPISYALTYPKRMANNFTRLNFANLGDISFRAPDLETFRCLQLAFDALRIGGTMPAVMNAANEVAVDLFLKEQIKFVQIWELVEGVMLEHQANISPSIDDILEVDSWARSQACQMALIYKG